MKLKRYPIKNRIIAGVDEAGRGCLAGPVVAAAVILPVRNKIKNLNDSKQLTAFQRTELRDQIVKTALAWSVGIVDNHIIDKINILNATFRAMHESISGLELTPDLLLIDGNRFKEYPGINHECIIKGDAKFISIAAASILAKTFRDELMLKLSNNNPEYNWNQNKGYPTKAHRKAIQQYGTTSFHRLTFQLLPENKIIMYEV